MELIIITILLIFVALLIVVMFLFLKKTVSKINQQSKDYFVDKLQAYDSLIVEREEKLKGLKNDIEKKQKKLLEEDNNKSVNNAIYLYDLKNIDYQDEKIFKKMKEIDQKFNIDTVKLVNRFIKEHFRDDTVLEYNKYINIRSKFNQEMIYKLISSKGSEQEKKARELMGSLSYIIDEYKKKNTKFEIKNFISYFNKSIDMLDPYIYVYVGSKDENYDNINEFIRTKVDENIYRGIFIVYRGKMYDYSLK